MNQPREYEGGRRGPRTNMKKQWTEAEDAVVRRYDRQMLTVEQATEIVGRSVSAVITRKYDLRRRARYAGQTIRGD